MPQAIARPCKRPGCAGLVRVRGIRYCGQHADLQTAEDAKRRARFDAERLPARERGYDRAWETVRRAHLAAHPLCELCLRDDKTEAAVLVHHEDEDPSNNASENLMSLSRACHERLHGRAK